MPTNKSLGIDNINELVHMVETKLEVLNADKGFNKLHLRATCRKELKKIGICSKENIDKLVLEIKSRDKN